MLLLLRVRTIVLVVVEITLIGHWPLASSLSTLRSRVGQFR
jgi:hypothetical protein